MPYHLQPGAQDAKDRAFGLSISPVKTLFTFEPASPNQYPVPQTTTEDRQTQANSEAESLFRQQDPVNGMGTTSPPPSGPIQIRAAAHPQGQRIPLTPPQSPRQTTSSLSHPLRVEEQRLRPRRHSSADTEDRLFFLAVGLFLGVSFLYWWVQNQDSIIFTIVSRWRDTNGRRPASARKDAEAADHPLKAKPKRWTTGIYSTLNELNKDVLGIGVASLEVLWGRVRALCRRYENENGRLYIRNSSEGVAVVATGRKVASMTSAGPRQDTRHGAVGYMAAGHFFPGHQQPAHSTELRHRRPLTSDQTPDPEFASSVQDIERGLGTSSREDAKSVVLRLMEGDFRAREVWTGSAF